MGELDAGQAAGFEGFISLAELYQAIDSCSSNKSPGLFGLPYEFYRAIRYKRYSGQKLVDIYNVKLESGDIIPSFRKGVTKLVSVVLGISKVNELY